MRGLREGESPVFRCGIELPYSAPEPETARGISGQPVHPVSAASAPDTRDYCDSRFQCFGAVEPTARGRRSRSAPERVCRLLLQPPPMAACTPMSGAACRVPSSSVTAISSARRSAILNLPPNPGMTAASESGDGPEAPWGEERASICAARSGTRAGSDASSRPPPSPCRPSGTNSPTTLADHLRR